MHVPVSLELFVNSSDGVAGDGKPDAFTTARLRKDEGVHADDVSVHVNQRTTAVSGIDGSIGLDVDHGSSRVDLAGHGANHAHADGIIEAERTAEREHQLSLLQV